MRLRSAWARLRGWQPTAAEQLAGGLLLGLLLLLATLYNEALYALFGGWWGQVGPAAQGPGEPLPSGPFALLLHHARNLPAVILYSGLYLGLCLGLLFLLVPAGASRRLVVLFYAGAGLATALLVLGSQLGGGPALATLASQLVHFLISPLPVIGLVPLLRWAAGQPPIAASRRMLPRK